MAAAESDVIIAINLPKLPVRPEHVDYDNINNINNDNVNIVNIFQSDIPDNKNFDIMETLDLSTYNLSRNKRYANIEYDRDEIEEGYTKGVHFFRIYNYTNQLVLREIQARLIVLIQRDLTNYENLMDVINHIQTKMNLKILLVDLISYRLDDGDKKLSQIIEPTFKTPEYMDIVFLNEEQKNTSGGKRKTSKRTKNNRKTRRFFKYY
jgi:hypothetical protein